MTTSQAILSLWIMVCAVATVTSAAFSVSPTFIEVPELSQVVLQGVNVPQDGAYTFQWFRDGDQVDVALHATAQTSVLVIENVKFNEAGLYSLQAHSTTKGTTLTSSTARVRVRFVPRITKQPPRLIALNPGQTLNISVEAIGYPEVTYQWFKDNVPLTNATESRLVLSSIVSQDAGMYSVQACNVLDCKESDNTVVSLNHAPNLVTPLANMTAVNSTLVTWTVVATGVPFPTVQWFRVGQLDPLSETLSLSFAPVLPSHEGWYFATIQNPLGMLETNQAYLKVAVPPVIENLSSNIEAIIGDTLVLRVSAQSSVPMSYQWLQNGKEILNATSSTLELESVGLTANGIYTVRVSNIAGTTVSSPVGLLVTPATVAIQATIVGKSVTLVVPAIGTSYTWKINGVVVNSTLRNSFTFETEATGSIAVEVVVQTAIGEKVLVAPAIMLPQPSSTIQITTTVPATTAARNTTTTIFAAVSNGPETSNIPLIAGAAAGGFIVVLVILIIVLLKRRRHSKQPAPDSVIAMNWNNPLDDAEVRAWMKELCPGPNGFQIGTPPILNPETIQLSRHIIANGDIAQVRMAKLTGQNNQPIPVEAKILRAYADEAARQSFMVEAYLLHNLQHKNVLRLFGVSVAGQLWSIVTELPLHGRLKGFLKNQALHSHLQPLTDAQLSGFALDIATGMQYLASFNCIHRALIAAHVAVTEDYICKLGEFGFARRLHSQCDEYEFKSQVFLSRWQAPEVLNGHKYRMKSDVWSFGVVMYEIWSGGQDPYTTAGWTSKNFVDRLNQNERMDPPKGCPTKIYTLMRECWHPDDTLRPHFSEIVAMLTTLKSSGDYGDPDPEPVRDGYEGQYIEVSLNEKEAESVSQKASVKSRHSTRTPGRGSRFSILYDAIRGRQAPPVLELPEVQETTFAEEGAREKDMRHSYLLADRRNSPEYCTAVDVKDELDLSPIRGDASVSSSFSEPTVHEIQDSPRLGRMMPVGSGDRNSPPQHALISPIPAARARKPKADLIPKPGIMANYANEFPAFSHSEEPEYSEADAGVRPKRVSESKSILEEEGMYANQQAIDLARNLQRNLQRRHESQHRLPYEMTSPENFKRDDSLVGSNISMFDSSKQQMLQLAESDLSGDIDVDEHFLAHLERLGEVLHAGEVDSIEADVSYGSNLSPINYSMLHRRAPSSRKHFQATYASSPGQENQPPTNATPQTRVDFGMCSPITQQAIQHMRLAAAQQQQQRQQQQQQRHQ
eukprot:m.210773 g.210773  ORF g.210773 m.210773 type:complete len:1243 (+) comp16939_c0_seq3:598-4326(+)